MIKRDKTAMAVPPRRGLLPRLRNVRIRSKLGLILIIPIVALVGLAVVRLAEAGQSVIRAQDAMKYAVVGQRAAELGEQLQAERSLAALFLAGSSRNRDAAQAAYDAQFVDTDKAVEEYATARDELQSVDDDVARLLNRIDAQLEELAELRDAIEDRDRITMSGAIFQYRIMIADLLAYRETLAEVAPEAANLARGGAALGAYTEYLSQEQVVGTILLARSEALTPADQESFLGTLAGQAESQRAFTNAVSDRHIADFQRVVVGEGVGKDAATPLANKRLEDLSSAELQAAVQDARRFETELRHAVPGTTLKLPGDAGAQQWSDAMAVRVALTRLVEEQLGAEFQAHIQERQQQLWSEVIAGVVIMLLVLFFAAVIALLIARSMARSLRRLREGALAVAYESLPQSVARLRNPETLGELTPDEVAASVKDPVQVRGRDEIGQVSQAFNVVHREAVRIAAEQAALRANVATMFINLARRSQTLVDRLIGHLDRLERGEEDPDRLAELFQLDHLATRMRRNDENLLVLAGADSTRVQREPAALSDVLRAAQSEVEQYTRVEFGIVDRDVEVAPHAVNDVVHLLAELFDNATSFSPPDSVVVVDARRAGDRAILQIEDRGIGISAEQLAELNTRLANPPLVDVAVSRMMGLVVVGRLASRHGIRVELRAARDRGTIADVILPAGVLILPQRAGRQTTLGLPHSRSPLALEGSRDADLQDWQPPAAPPQQPSRQRAGGWTPSHGGSGRDISTWGASGTPSMGGPPSRREPTDLGGAMSGAAPGRSGGRDPNLPKRRPGGQISPTGQPIPANQQPNPAAEQPLGHGGMNDVRNRLPAAEPGPRAEPPRAERPRRESIHSAELPLSQLPQSRSVRPAGELAQPERGTPGSGFASGARSRNAAGPGLPPGRTPQSNGTGMGGPVGGRATPAAAPAGSPNRAPDPSLIPPNADDTMELPIFREVESAWFRTKQPGKSPAQAGPAERREPAAPSRPSDPATGKARATSPVRQPGQATGEQPPATPSDPGGWRTAADDGWRAASAAAESQDVETTSSGLPKRVPMAQLVPGGVDTTQSAARNRSPDAVRGLLSAYHRGVQRGRQSSARTSSDEGPGKEQA